MPSHLRARTHSTPGSVGSAAEDGALLDAISGVRWPSRRSVAAGLVGVHPSRQRGSSSEFSEYRSYRPGDDPRRLDWRLLARSDRAYVRLTTDRAILPTTVIVDASASMAFPLPALDKWRVARGIALALAAIAHADGDPVGLVVAAAEGPMAIRPRTRRGVVAEVARVLRQASPSGAAPIAPFLGPSLRTAAARIAIVTDLLGDDASLLRSAALHVVGGGEVHLVHIVAREELHPDIRARLVRDPEATATERMLSEPTRAEYQRRFASWRADAARSWRTVGASYTEVLTSEEVERAARRIVESRGAAGGLPG
jgi:uncharacterized protein (DUF58 family)